MKTMSGGPCLHYDCTNRNSFGYCKTTACINEHYQQEQWGLQSTTNKSESVIIKQQTNADKIRSMTDEELVNFVVHHDCCPGFVMDTFSDENRRKYGFDGRSERCECGECCYECWIDWLKQKTEDGE